ncbi:MAG: MurR/RpiR family transcriptional regulator [Lachnospiraceae bacterium]|nr:MurR/RpiR family transcriptional regulator [Lachnospiraceae bacterium]
MDNLIIERISNAQLTKSQKKIADYFIRNQQKIGNLSAMDVAQEIGVSDASVIRFARAIGFDGYADMKEHFYNALIENSFGSLSLSERMKQSDEKFRGGDTMEQFYSIIKQNTYFPLEHNRPAVFEKVADGLVNANQKCIVGLRGCRGAALQFGRVLSFLLPNVSIITDGECTSTSKLMDLRKEDAMLMFHFPRYYKVDRQFMELAHRKKAKIYLITSDITGDLSSYADEVILVQTTSMTFFHSVIGANVIAEYLMLLIGRKTDSRTRLQERDDLIAYQRE